MARRNTRELILQTSLALFNEWGEPNVTTNHIADEADISPGNLYYHFRSKDDIVLELFKRFLVRFQPLIEVPPDVLFEAEDLWFQLHMSFEIKGEFRFLYRNLADLTARIPNLEHAMRGLMRRERDSARNSLRGLQQAGVVDLEDQELELLVESILLGLTYWIAFAELFDDESVASGEAQGQAIARLLLSVTPHMREPEQSRFRELALRYTAGH